MYRFLVLALVLTLAVAFSGCGPKTEAPARKPQKPAVSAPPAQPPAAGPAPPAESATEAAAAAAGDESKAGAAEENWSEFEVVPSASASAQKKE